MAADERNFRSAYYEKVGCRSVEEKKSLEILLKDKPLDRGRLRQFCLRFSVPGSYRNLIWKLLLGVIPVHVDCHSFIMEQRRQEYNDLHRALTVMRVIDQNTPKSQIFLDMWLLQSGNYTYHIGSTHEKVFTSIVQVFMQFFSDDTDVFWLTRNFYEIIHKFEPDIPKLIEYSHSLLEKEDPVYYKSLQKNGLLENVPLTKWFECCFADILPDQPLAKIWDKICGGSYKILVYIAIVLLTNLKHRILLCSNITGVVQCIRNISEDNADIIVNKSIEMWQHHGSLLTVHDKPKP